MISSNLSKLFKNVKLLVSDVDGVLTDGKLLISSDNIESKFFSVEDATGVALAEYAKLHIALISGRYSNTTEIRAKELKIKYCYQGVLDKKNKLFELLKIYNVTLDEVAYIGDSLVDVPVLEIVGCPISVPNGHQLAKKKALFITEKIGGEGVLFEIIEKILLEQGKYEKILELMKNERFS